MGFRFRKSFKLLPGVRVNLGNKSSSISLGGKGARYTVSTSGRRTTSVGIPGTGISYSETHGRKKKTSSKPTSSRQSGGTKKQNSPVVCSNCGAELSSTAKVCRYCRTKVKKPTRKKWLVWILVLALLGSCGRSCIDADTQEQPSGLESSETTISDDTPIEQIEPEEIETPTLDVEPDPIEETPVLVPPIEETPVVEEPVYEEPVAEEPVEVVVYVTNTGEKYHRENCQYLKKSKIPKTLSEAQQFYEPCSKCKP